MVAVVVGDEREVEHRGELGGAAVDEVDREERLGGLDDEAHVVDAPDRRNVADLRGGGLGLDLVEGALQPLKRGKAARVAVSEVGAVGLCRHQVGLALPAVERGVVRRGRSGARDGGRSRRGRPGDDEFPSARHGWIHPLYLSLISMGTKRSGFFARRTILSAYSSE